MSKHHKNRLNVWPFSILAIIALFALIIINIQYLSLSSPAGQFSLNDYCTGFTYFQYNNHVLTTSSLSLTAINSDQEIRITGMSINSIPVVLQYPVSNTSPGYSQTIIGNVNTGKNRGESYNYPVEITYDVIGGASGNSDLGTCTGIVR